MNRDRIQGTWKVLSGKCRERWGLLIADRLSVVAGQHDQRAGRAQVQYGCRKEESADQLRHFLRNFRRSFKR
ncbi:MAG TPA: general stress protein CsbD [Burkholderiales bacterium]|nr:general stress protein CsbD [Burkholderiales bacterium]